MATVILTCGKLCSGKSTYARKLQAERNAVLLSIDELTLALFPEGAGDRHDLYAERSERYLLELSLQILRAGTDVVLDWGLWTRAVRTRVRGFYASRGIPCELHYLRVPAEEWARRIARRNAQMQSGGTSAYFVDEGLLRKAESLFEEPSPEEIDRIIDC